MTKLAMIVLILALPALVAADIDRLRPSPDFERPDALAWNTRTHEPELPMKPPVPPAWQGACASGPTGPGRSQIQRLVPVPEHVALCQSQPDCRSHVNAPALWPHAPRTDEQKTTDKERRQKQARTRNKHPATSVDLF